jgi:hypothetical protein
VHDTVEDHKPSTHREPVWINAGPDASAVAEPVARGAYLHRLPAASSPGASVPITYWPKLRASCRVPRAACCVLLLLLLLLLHVDLIDFLLDRK